MEEGRPGGRGDLELGRALVVADAVWSRPREGARAWQVCHVDRPRPRPPALHHAARRLPITDAGGWPYCVLYVLYYIIY